MRLLRLTLPTPAENLALDEALLNDPAAGETLRLWESPRPFVVLGRSSRIAEEADLPVCRELGVEVLRRVSGGASIVTGPGCLMYAVTLDLAKRPELEDLGRAHDGVLSRLVAALEPLEPGVQQAGTSDLAAPRDGVLHKFSGNSLRRARGRLLYHGTLLYDYDLPLIGRLLRTAPRQPEYRERRDHDRFVTNLGCGADAIAAALQQVWGAAEAEPEPTTLRLALELVAEKYAHDAWNASR